MTEHAFSPGFNKYINGRYTTYYALIGEEGAAVAIVTNFLDGRKMAEIDTHMPLLDEDPERWNENCPFLLGRDCCWKIVKYQIPFDDLTDEEIEQMLIGYYRNEVLGYWNSRRESYALVD